MLFTKTIRTLLKIAVDEWYFKNFTEIGPITVTQSVLPIVDAKQESSVTTR